MDKTNLVAINIFVKEKLINPNGIPILWNWNGEDDIHNELKNAINSIDKFKDTLYNIDNFGTSRITYFYFVNDENGNKCKNVSELIQNWVLPSTFDSVVNDCLVAIFSYLYQCVNHEEYIWGNDFDTDINNIYNVAKETYPKRVAKTTVINYVRTELLSKYGFTPPNINKVIQRLEKIIEDNDE